ncbi:hypothetical protein ASPWEDRAFT_100570 [Aspergillus wentii DTO 134E9]|uniref:JmjC domain-containing protein n=1 Tax=Aspergillus wentii DTO 134E9 TaxID=1073089 RepID=A0A1L9S276_ASPWE|nr:uncharacterized protein ASPWEDRAFT_100570 [Aspergillus wentii DTO 134E9]OJJ41267.1 hypothetical protein ASPWEDRAFT_100570 [Aspergillus wentii DTO 134E9]
MPAQRPRAAFEPISPDLNLAQLVESTANFEFAVRIPCDSIDNNGLESFNKLVLLHVILGGRPLVIEGFNKRLDSSLFSEKWLREHYSAKMETARDLTNKSNIPLSIGHYLNNMPLLTNQWTPYNYQEPNRQRIYLKDIDCPPEWHDHLKKNIPPSLFYLNECLGVTSASSNKNGTALPVTGTQIITAGDLMSCLPPHMRAENLMCYIGHEGTYTPCHQEMCASLGQNLMVEASDGSIENGKQTKQGSSIWFMTESKDRHVVSEYWMSTLGHDIDIEDHFAQINALKGAPFKVYIVEQKPGDFILIPPLAAQQVWNRGTRTTKVAWNRTTVETLDMALNEALPHARMVCRDEQYKNKAIVFFALERYSALFSHVNETNKDYSNSQQLRNDFQHLFSLYTYILLSECFSRTLPEENNVEYFSFDGNVTCSYCRCNIFNRFLTCPSCVGTLTSDGEDTYDICMECYAMGRSCACISRLKWVEQFHWGELTKNHEMWRQKILELDNDLKDHFQPLPVERARLGKKTLAEICQEQLIMRPWVDITKPVTTKVEGKTSDSENTTPPRKRRKVRASAQSKEDNRCHICKYTEPPWKLASCSYCKLNYCYGSLFRAFNILPQDTMEMYHWMCPKCLKICSCGACRKNPNITPFEPTCTLLGHDTRKIADPRSVDSLVDFRHSNLRWLKNVGDDEAGPLKKRLEAEERRNQSLVENCIQLEESPQVKSQQPTDYGEIPVDPALEHLDNSFFMPDSISL